MTRLDARLRIAIYVLAFGLIAAAFMGGWLMYTPIPFFDGWDGNVSFQMLLKENPGLLFSQHNEHRLVVTRVLLLVDYYVFGGRHIFLVMTNYAFALGVWFVFWRCLKVINKNKVDPKDLKLLGMVLGGWIFLWSQNINFTWGFQNQVHSAQFFPLLAFLLLGRASERTQHQYWIYGGAIVAGVVSAGTMANGALALPLMAVWAIQLRMRVLQTIGLALAGAIILALYTQGYHTPSNHSTVFSTVLEHPISVILFVFKFLGNPFVHVISPFGIGSIIAILLGATMTGAGAYLSLQIARHGPRNGVIAGLVLYIVYVGATAFLTAGGRVFIVEYIAFTTRYTTPTILAWTALTCIISPWIFRMFYTSKDHARGILIFSTLGLLAAFVPVVRTILPTPNFHHNQNIAALSLELGIRDDEQIGYTYSNAEHVLRIADRASSADFGIFGRTPYRGLREMIGTYWIASSTPTCTGYLTETYPLEHAPDHSRVDGRIMPVARGSKRSRVLIIDENGMIVGAGLTKAPRRETQEGGEKVRTAKFTGYVSAAHSAPFRFASEACQAT